MVRHVVMFKFVEFNTPEEKKAEMLKLKVGLEALKDKMDFIHLLRVDLNINPQESWDMVLTLEADTLDEVRTYSNHPDHVAGVKAFATRIAGRACVDYVI